MVNFIKEIKEQKRNGNLEEIIQRPNVDFVEEIKRSRTNNFSSKTSFFGRNRGYIRNFALALLFVSGSAYFANKCVSSRNIDEESKGEYQTTKVIYKYKEAPEKKIINLDAFKDLYLNDKYKFVIVDKDLEMPYSVSPKILEVAEKIKEEGLPEEERAKEIFNWIDSNISYNVKKLPGAGYKNSEEVIETNQGVCGEMAYLYVTMARLINLKANWVYVDQDVNGKKVSHAMAVVDINGKQIFVDPAYRTYDIHHKSYRIMDDKETIDLFRSMRNSSK